jgi:hypothetical protein
VALTPPSIEFSIGTTARSNSPSRTARIADGTSTDGTASSVSGSMTWLSASWVNVPVGPR